MRTLGTSLAVLMLFAVGFAAGTAQAQKLPSCPADPNVRWHDCVGTYTFADGSKYVGGWRDDNRHGQGTYTWADGDKYVGEHRDGLSHGQGTLYAANGSVLKEGQWENGELVRSFRVSEQQSPKEQRRAAAQPALALAPSEQLGVEEQRLAAYRDKSDSLLSGYNIESPAGTFFVTNVDTYKSNSHGSAHCGLDIVFDLDDGRGSLGWLAVYELKDACKWDPTAPYGTVRESRWRERGMVGRTQGSKRAMAWPDSKRSLAEQWGVSAELIRDIDGRIPRLWGVVRSRPSECSLFWSLRGRRTVEVQICNQSSSVSNASVVTAFISGLRVR